MVINPNFEPAEGTPTIDVCELYKNLSRKDQMSIFRYSFRIIGEGWNYDEAMYCVTNEQRSKSLFSLSSNTFEILTTWFDGDHNKDGSLLADDLDLLNQWNFTESDIPKL